MSENAFAPFLIRVPHLADESADGASAPQLHPSFAAKTGESALPLTSYAEARREAILAFERSYVRAVLSSTGGNVSEAARIAQIDRVYLHRLIRRHRPVRPAVARAPAATTTAQARTVTG